MSEQFPPERISELRAFINKPGLSGTEGIYIAQIETSDCLDTIEIQAEQMATALGIPPDRYRKYETRSPMPAYLIERFALIVGADIQYVLTGKSDRRAGSDVAQTIRK